MIDAGGELTNALMGEMLLMQATKRGVAGVVINGAIRDAAYMRAQHLRTPAGSLFRIIVHAAEAAVRSGAERIDAGLIEASARIERRDR